MNLHEYQSKKILMKYKLPVPNGFVCTTLKEIKKAIKKINKKKKAVLKCQVHAGGRGKIGAVKIINNLEEAEIFYKKWFGKKLINNQTSQEGQTINKILVEEKTKYLEEFYLAVLIDRTIQKIIVITSKEGGMEIEKIANKKPNLIYKSIIDPFIGAMPYQARNLAFNLGLKGKLINQFIEIFIKLTNIFIKKDFELVEINPIVITQEKKLLFLDSKIIVDNNALYRQKKIRKMYDPSQENPKEVEASKWNLNYVPLNGNIGCIVNGAGLAMATMDMIKLHGGKPANFLDVGGSATKERVKEAFKIILSDKNIKTILINIFGGIVRCDLIADGIISAIKEITIKIPLVIRLEGNNCQLGMKKLVKSKLKISVAKNLTDAAIQSVSKSKG